MIGSVLFRPDAGPNSGLGHLSRCLSLAEAVRRAGGVSVMLIGSDVRIERQMRAAAHVVERCVAADDGGPDYLQLRTAARRHGCRWVVVDSYEAQASYLRELRAAGLLLVAIDDLAGEPLPAHIVVNGGAQALGLRYLSSTADTRFLLGPSYALIRPEFWGVSDRPVSATVRHVLITVGGSDRLGITGAILSAVRALPTPVDVAVVVGPFFEELPETVSEMSHSRLRITVVRSPPSLVDLMRAADLAVAGGGQTLYELAATGTPAIGLQLADNQASSLVALVAAGVTAPGGAVVGGVLPASFIERLTALASDAVRRRAMASAGRAMVDGRGAERVVAAMQGWA